MPDGLTDQSMILLPSTFNFVRFTDGYTPSQHVEGRVFYDNNAKTLALMTEIDDVVLQIGQEQYLRARNDQGAQIDNGEAVYISGSTGDIANVKLAKADAAATASAIGLATEDYATDANGFYTTFGIVRGLDTSALVIGDVWLSPAVAGGLTNVKPVAPDVPVLIGTCIRVHATQGQIFVNVVRSI